MSKIFKQQAWFLTELLRADYTKISELLAKFRS